MRAGERLWAIGDVNGIWPLTHVGEYEGDVVAANIAGDPRPANYEAVPRVTYTDPQAAAAGALEADYGATAAVSEVPKTATYTHAYAESNGFLTLLSDGQRLTGGYALGPRPVSGCSRRPSPSARTCRSRCSATRSSPSPASPGSTTRR
jgi:pyruvate/2-oxoglutarate dehydrogenase complex dihydrolipoamide dehydrogenase (E3) component